MVKYYGSYFKNTDLWIVMEYCGAGSVSDIIRLRNKTVRPFSFECIGGSMGVQQLKEAEYLGHNSQCSMPDTTIGHNLRARCFVPLKTRKLLTLSFDYLDSLIGGAGFGVLTFLKTQTDSK